MSEFIVEDEGRVDSALVADRLAKNVRMSAYALRLEGAPYLYALQPNLYVTEKPLAPAEQAAGERAGLGKSDPDPDGVSVYHRRCYARLRSDLARIDEPGFRFVDMSSAFDDLGAGTTVFFDPFHFGDRGNQVIAKALVPHVVEALSEDVH